MSSGRCSVEDSVVYELANDVMDWDMSFALGIIKCAVLVLASAGAEPDLSRL